MGDNYKIQTFNMILPIMSAYVKRYDWSKSMFFLTEDDELSKKYNDIWIKSAITSKQNLIANPSSIKHFWKPK